MPEATGTGEEQEHDDTQGSVEGGGDNHSYSEEQDGVQGNGKDEETWSLKMKDD